MIPARIKATNVEIPMIGSEDQKIGLGQAAFPGAKLSTCCFQITIGVRGNRRDGAPLNTPPISFRNGLSARNAGFTEPRDDLRFLFGAQFDSSEFLKGSPQF